MRSVARVHYLRGSQGNPNAGVWSSSRSLRQSLCQSYGDTPHDSVAREYLVRGGCCIGDNSPWPGVGSAPGRTGQREDSRVRQFFLAGALLAALCISAVAGAPLSDAEIVEILTAHNGIRQRVARSESQRLRGTVSIPNLTWDPAAAALAQQWADALIKRDPPTGGHRKQEELQQLDLGENWFLAWSEGTPNVSAKAVVESWAEEEKWYNYEDNTCAAGKECLHYTQLVWSNTQRLGAGRAMRTTDDGRTYVIWVCNYAPAGNIKGERPYKVTHGPAVPEDDNWARRTPPH
jgi:pathogenesis-related protein 1